MKYYISYFIVFISLFACKEDPIGQQPLDKIPPGAVSGVKFVNTPGGAVLTYSLPSDEDLLYVKAVYSLKDGIQSEVRTSLYSDTLKIVGFGDTNPHEVSVIAVDRSRNESQPVEVNITPLEPSVNTIGKTLNLISDFGGLSAYWNNRNRAEVSVWLLKENDNKEYVPLETFYSSVIDGKGSVRGMDTVEVKVGAYIQDRWENKSQIKYFTLTPLYETLFDRLKFKEVHLPGDATDAFGWKLPNLWDGIIGTDNGFHTPQGTGIWPQWITFDLGVLGKLSRVVYFQRQGDWPYAHGNPRKLEVWGAETLDPTGSWNSWVKLADYTCIKPSGLPVGENTAEDRAKAAAGEEIIISPLEPKVRYLRIKVTETWSGGDFFHISEVRVYGDNREKSK